MNTYRRTTKRPLDPPPACRNPSVPSMRGRRASDVPPHRLPLTIKTAGYHADAPLPQEGAEWRNIDDRRERAGALAPATHRRPFACDLAGGDVHGQLRLNRGLRSGDTAPLPPPSPSRRVALLFGRAEVT